MKLKNLKNEAEIYIIGHSKPDVDTIVSGKILCDILTSFGVNCTNVVIEGDVPNKYNMNMILDCMEYNPLIIKENDIKNHKYILVDHNDITQSVKDSSLVLGCFDHHHDSGSVESPFISNFCCNAFHIYDFFKEKYDFSDLQKSQIFMAFLSDSKFSKNSRYKDLDIRMVESLGFSEDYDELFKKYFITTNLDNKTEAFNSSNYKSYNFGDLSFESTCINSFGIEGLEGYSEFVQNYDGDFLGVWVDYTNNLTYTFFKKDGEFSVKYYDFVASRATTILTDVLKKVNTYVKKKWIKIA